MRKIVFSTFIIGWLFGQFDWQDNGIAVRQGVHIEWQRTADVGGDGTIIFAWSDTRKGGRDIYAQKVDQNGNKLWLEDGIVVVEEDGRQEDPILVTDGNGGAYIVWVDYKDEPEDGDIYAQHILSNGSLAWEASGIGLTTVPGKQVSPNMCSDGNGGAYVIWKDLVPSSYGHVYGTRLSNSGALSLGTGIPLLSNEANHNNVSIEKGSSGHAVLVWSDDSLDDNADIRAQRIDQNCNTLWSLPEEGGIILCSSDFDQLYPKVTYYDENYSVFVWEDHRNSTSDIDQSDIYFQFLDASGNSILSDNGMPVCTDNATQIKPRVKASSQGAYVVWEDLRNLNNDIYSQKFDHTGAIFWEANGVAIVNEVGIQNQARLTVDASGGAYYVWSDERNNAYPETEVYLQYIDSQGNSAFEQNGLAVCDAEYYQFSPIVRPSSNGALVVWGDRRTGSIGLYVQSINPSSGIGLEPQGREMFFGIDGNGQSPKSVNLPEGESVIYWDDRRYSPFETTTYGLKFDGSNSLFDNQNGISLSDNAFQSDASIVYLENSLFFGFGQTDGDVNQYYDILDTNLNSINGSSAVSSNQGASQEYYHIVYNEYENLIYYIYSDNGESGAYNIYAQQFDLSGNPTWSSPVKIVETLVDGFLPSDDNVVSAFSGQNNGCVILYNSGNFLGTKINAIAIDSDGNIQNGWNLDGVRLCDYESDQYLEGAFKTPYGILSTFRDNRSGANDIYLQLISFSGQRLLDNDGLAIANAENDQESSSLAFSEINNQALICWEDFRLGTEYDLYCRFINLDMNSDESVSYFLQDEIEVSGQNNTSGGNQTTPYVYANQFGSFLVVWEDSRNDVYTDIYFQELSDCEIFLEDGGELLCNADFDQLNPRIDKLSETNNSYVIYWDDLRSSGKEFLTNVFAQSFTSDSSSSQDCSGLAGDVNQDDNIDVLDIVLIVNHITGNALLNDAQLNSADFNGDSSVDVLDIVQIVNNIIS